MDYVHVGQDDLAIYFDYSENLSGYTGKLHYYLQSAGTSSSTSVTATVSTQTTALTYVYYNMPVGNSIFDDDGTWVLWPEVTAADSRTRAAEPVYLQVVNKGIV
jgi:hypothetical protein